MDVIKPVLHNFPFQFPYFIMTTLVRFTPFTSAKLIFSHKIKRIHILTLAQNVL